jgi:hypothetical protein
MIQIKKIDLGFENKLNNKQPTLPDYGQSYKLSNY